VRNKVTEENCISFYSSTNITGINKPQKMRWAGHTACMKPMRSVYKLLIGNLERVHLVELCVAERIILKWIFKGTGW
jgi:hypothetical protein